ncbi:MAG TPA: 7-cyano-7-deazaguanine synthase QueC [Hyphomicrobium sp.]|uniref:7-cyano-7-deazaguanine synthase QueC n=1 Tax=Hyphomicrobium sp. TaxID=82 RepID=UPI002CFF3614|nr:7-cyano-7-deazaguanine synthase QueC [Hyphomicrobium sp.]HXE01013.1 7-cyano-7-deazaguanine synthase QueC [Hyphomicrobium sp.]
MTSSSALVLFSGGQDSTVCLAWALERYEAVETIGFTYGQRHIVEIEQRAVVRSKLATLNEAGRRLGPDTVLDLAALKSVSDTALTRETEITFAATGLPTTFVPARNLLFLTYAAALAYRRGIGTLVGGMCETDFSGYPDCRNDTVQALAHALSLGLDKPMSVETPLMFIDKAATWELASSLGGQKLIDLIIEDTHTCYLGDRSHRHPWGYGCGQCPACELRAKGWTAWQARKI